MSRLYQSFVSFPASRKTEMMFAGRNHYRIYSLHPFRQNCDYTSFINYQPEFSKNTIILLLHTIKHSYHTIPNYTDLSTLLHSYKCETKPKHQNLQFWDIKASITCALRSEERSTFGMLYIEHFTGVVEVLYHLPMTCFNPQMLD